MAEREVWDGSVHGVGRVYNGLGSRFNMLEAFTEAVILVAASKIRRVVWFWHTWHHKFTLVILHGTTSATREVNHTTLIVQK